MHAVLLEQLITGAPLSAILTSIACSIEAHCPGSLCSILLLDEGGQQLRLGAAPSLPGYYNQAIDGVQIGRGVGSCGTAAYSGKCVIVEDIGRHPYWADYKDIALSAGLRACWSTPVRNRANRVCGTFAIYHNVPWFPQPEELAEIASFVSLVGTAIDYHRMQSALQKSETSLRTLIDSFPFMVWFKDRQSRLQAANKAYAKVTGVASTHDLEGMTDFDFFPDHLARKYVGDDRRVIETGVPFSDIEPLRDNSGSYRWIEVHKTALQEEGVVVGTVGFARDVTEVMHREYEFQSLIEHSPTTFARYDRLGRRLFVNARKAEYYGVQQNFLVDKRPSEFPGGETGQALEAAIAAVFDTGKHTELDELWFAEGGRSHVLRVRLAPEFDASGQVVAVIGVGQDVTASVENEAKLHHMAFYDALTDLPNRAMFLDQIRQLVTRAEKGSEPFALMLLDLDHFKRINDTLGHAVGDRLLAEVASRLVSCVGQHNVAARIGGDEFAILLRTVDDRAGLKAFADRVIATLAPPCRIDGGELFVSVSMGIACYPADSAEIDELFKFADSALHHAKIQGRNNLQFYSSAMTRTMAEQMQLESDLRRALAKGELLLYYQPKVDLHNGRAVGAEALLRWRHPQQGIISPERFIRIAEESGMIVDIGAWVIATACRRAREWNAESDKPVHIAINLSSRQFMDKNLLSLLLRSLEQSGCRPEWLQVEITESLLLENSRSICATLDALDALGIVIAMDDFGTGYSSLSYLNNFPVSQIKIDRSFVRDITSHRRPASLVTAIVAMARSLDKVCVAEGVESAAQAEVLRDMGCDLGQGFYFGRPLPAVGFGARLSVPGPP